MIDGYDRIEGLLAAGSLAELGPNRRPEAKSIAQLDRELAPIFREVNFSKDVETSIRAAIYLWHDHLSESHRLAQDVDTPDGSLVHGIMHRREPDYTNAEYWFRRTGRHESFDELGRAAWELLQGRHPEVCGRVSKAGQWDPFAFLQLCEGAETSPKWRRVLEELQGLEFQALLRSLWRKGENSANPR